MDAMRYKLKYGTNRDFANNGTRSAFRGYFTTLALITIAFSSTISSIAQVVDWKDVPWISEYRVSPHPGTIERYLNQTQFKYWQFSDGSIVYVGKLLYEAVGKLPDNDYTNYWYPPCPDLPWQAVPPNLYPSELTKVVSVNDFGTVVAWVPGHSQASSEDDDHLYLLAHVNNVNVGQFLRCNELLKLLYTVPYTNSLGVESIIPVCEVGKAVGVNNYQAFILESLLEKEMQGEDGDAEYRLGEVYLRGEYGAVTNLRASEEYLSKAITNGYPQASNLLNEVKHTEDELGTIQNNRVIMAFNPSVVDTIFNNSSRFDINLDKITSCLTNADDNYETSKDAGPLMGTNIELTLCIDNTANQQPTVKIYHYLGSGNLAQLAIGTGVTLNNPENIPDKTRALIKSVSSIIELLSPSNVPSASQWLSKYINNYEHYSQYALISNFGNVDICLVQRGEASLYTGNESSPPGVPPEQVGGKSLWWEIYIVPKGNKIILDGAENDWNGWSEPIVSGIPSNPPSLFRHTGYKDFIEKYERSRFVVIP